MKFHDELNPKLWDKNNEEYTLKEEVKEKLKQIAEAFIDYLDIPQDSILDMVITGSSASYNYTPQSDLDLHIIVDYDKIHEDCPIVEGYLGALKSAFNKEHDIFIHGVPVELYAEEKDQGTVHNGLYSLNTGWIDVPKKIPPTDNDAAVEAKYQEIKDMIDKCENAETALDLLDKIYTMRKAGLADAGEFSTENLTFKKLRNEGLMDKLRQLKKENIDKQLTLENYNQPIINENVDEIKTEIQNKIKEFFNNDEDILSWTVVEVEKQKDGIRVEVRAELSYRGMENLADVLNPIVSKYDEYAYFDFDQPGIMTAYIEVDSLNEANYTTKGMAYPFRVVCRDNKGNSIDIFEYYTEKEAEEDFSATIDENINNEVYEISLEKLVDGKYVKIKTWYAEDESDLNESYNQILPHNIDKIKKLIQKVKESNYFKIDGEDISVNKGFGTVGELIDLQALAEKFEELGFKVRVNYFQITVYGLKDFINQNYSKNESIKEEFFVGNGKYIIVPVSYYHNDIRILDKKTGEFLKNKNGDILKFPTEEECGNYIKSLEGFIKESLQDELIKEANKITNRGMLYMPVRKLAAKLVDRVKGTSDEEALKVAKMFFKETKNESVREDKNDGTYLQTLRKKLTKWGLTYGDPDAPTEKVVDKLIKDFPELQKHRQEIIDKVDEHKKKHYADYDDVAFEILRRTESTQNNGAVKIPVYKMPYRVTTDGASGHSLEFQYATLDKAKKAAEAFRKTGGTAIIRFSYEDEYGKIHTEIVDESINEAYEWKGPIARVTFDNGEVLETAINGTDEEIKSYYMGKTFNLGKEEDDMHKVVKVEVIRESVEDVHSNFKSMAKRIVRDFKVKGYPKSNKFYMDFAKEAVAGFKKDWGYDVKISTGNGELILTLEDTYQAVINTETHKIKFSDLENSNYMFESLYEPSTIIKALKLERAWYDEIGLEEDEQAPQVMFFVIEDHEIKDTKLVDRQDVYTYKPEENEYYLDRVRDTGDDLTDYNLSPVQKMVDLWNKYRKPIKEGIAHNLDMGYVQQLIRQAKLNELKEIISKEFNIFKNANSAEEKSIATSNIDKIESRIITSNLPQEEYDDLIEFIDNIQNNIIDSNTINLKESDEVKFIKSLANIPSENMYFALYQIGDEEKYVVMDNVDAKNYPETSVDVKFASSWIDAMKAFYETDYVRNVDSYEDFINNPRLVFSNSTFKKFAKNYFYSMDEDVATLCDKIDATEKDAKELINILTIKESEQLSDAKLGNYTQGMINPTYFGIELQKSLRELIEELNETMGK